MNSLGQREVLFQWEPWIPHWKGHFGGSRAEWVVLGFPRLVRGRYSQPFDSRRKTVIYNE